MEDVLATCPRCHSTIADDDHVCKVCGAPIDTSLPTDAATPAPPTEPAVSASNSEEQITSDSSPTLYSNTTPSISSSPTVVPTQSKRQELLGQRSQWLLVLVTLGALGFVLLFACIGLGYVFFNARNTTIFLRSAPTATPASTRTPRPTPVGQVESQVTPTLSGNIVLRDTFSRTNVAGLVGEDDEVRYAFEDGGYAITVKVEQLGVWRKFDPTYTNIAAQVATTLVDGPESAAAGLIFRYQDNKNFYMFNVSDNGQYNLEVRKNDAMTTLIDWTPSTTIKNKGETNVLRVETVDNTITLYINGTKLETTTDNTFNKGQLAIAVNTFDQGNAKVRFDDLIVEEQ